MTDLELDLLRNRVLMVVQEEDRKHPETEQQLFLRARIRLITPDCDQRLLHFIIWEEIDMLDVPTSVRHDVIIWELQHGKDVT